MADTYYTKEAVTKTLIEYFQCSHISESFIKAVVEQIPVSNVIPAADVRPVVHGYWKFDLIYPSGIRRFRCDQCGEKTTDTCMDRPRANFCPNCGADMREAKDGPA